MRSAAALLRGGAGRRDLNALNVGWDDFANAGSEGRWWLVGAKWRGSQHGSNAHGTNQANAGGAGAGDADGAARRAATAAAAKGVTGADKLLRLAALHRMNTDVRRSVFSIVMGASDYVDAAARLTTLSAKQLRKVRSSLLLFIYSFVSSILLFTHSILLLFTHCARRNAAK